MNSRIVERAPEWLILSLLMLLIIVGLTFWPFGCATLTEVMYLNTGVVCALLAACIVGDKNRWAFVAESLLFVIFPIGWRLGFGPVLGLTYQPLSTFLVVIVMQSVLVILLFSARKMQTGKARLATVLFLVATSFTAQAVALPMYLGEPLRRHQFTTVQMKDPGVYVAAQGDGYVFWSLAPPHKGLFSVQGQDSVAKQVEFDATEVVLGVWCDAATARLVVREGASNEGVPIALISCSSDGSVGRQTKVCKSRLVTNEWTNVLSPDGSTIALNYGVFVDFVTVEPIRPEGEIRPVPGEFIEWSRGSGRAVFFNADSYEVVLADVQRVHEASLPLSGRTNDPRSIAISLREDRVVYAAEQGAVFVCENVETGTLTKLAVPERLRLRMDSRPMWIGDKQIAYITRCNSLYTLDLSTGRFRLLPQIAETVIGAAFAPRSNTLVWTTWPDRFGAVHRQVMSEITELNK